jgi:protein SCO1/2
MKRNRLLGASLALVIGALLPIASARAFDVAPGEGAGTKITSKPDAQVPLDLVFTDESGKSVKLGDFFHADRPVVLSLVYFGCPKLCSLSLNGLTTSLRGIDLKPGEQFEIITVSFDPKEGSNLAAAKKENYIKSLGKPQAAADWHFLTSSDPTAARALGDAIGFGYRLMPDGQYLHQAGIFVCTPEGRVSRVQEGVQFDRTELSDSLINASKGKISSGLFGVALECGFYSFDAATGKYVLASVWIMRVTAISTVLLLGSCIGWMIYRENQKKKLEENLKLST